MFARAQYVVGGSSPCGLGLAMVCIVQNFDDVITWLPLAGKTPGSVSRQKLAVFPFIHFTRLG